PRGRGRPRSRVRPRAAALVLFLVIVACASAGTQIVAGLPAHHVPGGGFRNLSPAFGRPSAWTRWSFIGRRAWQSLTAPRAFDAPRVANDGAALRTTPPPAAITWIGHATLLVQVDGLSILTDPQWSDRAGPASFIGARRLSPPGLAFEQLPRIDVVVISHDHYDHLDLPTVKRLASTHDPLFLVPLGLAAWFRDNGMPHVEELDWWQEREHRGVRFVCVAALAIGAYSPASIMKWVHTTPEEAVQAFLDMGARTMLGMHWGTFDLADEPLDEPPVRMRADFERRGLDPARAWIPKLGETRAW